MTCKIAFFSLDIPAVHRYVYSCNGGNAIVTLDNREQAEELLEKLCGGNYVMFPVTQNSSLGKMVTTQDIFYSREHSLLAVLMEAE